ncbi:MAG: hypothetical protein IT385_12770 [Deltaproteobacteria bacterium]|nr:hypothetical protein [Deltaproteobacteria bacterium]
MCRRVTCAKCKKPSWAGCGAHVESVLRGVPPSERCRCREASGDAPPAPPATTDGLAGWLKRLFRG